jgi:hypothetical protein
MSSPDVGEEQRSAASRRERAWTPRWSTTTVAALQESRPVEEAILQLLADGSDVLGERGIRATVEAYETLPLLGA